LRTIETKSRRPKDRRTVEIVLFCFGVESLGQVGVVDRMSLAASSTMWNQKLNDPLFGAKEDWGPSFKIPKSKRRAIQHYAGDSVCCGYRCSDCTRAGAAPAEHVGAAAAGVQVRVRKQVVPLRRRAEQGTPTMSGLNGCPGMAVYRGGRVNVGERPSGSGTWSWS